MLLFKSHQISSIQLTFAVRKPETIALFQYQAIQKRSFSDLQLKSSTKTHRGINASSSEESKGVGDDDEAPRMNWRWRELLLDPDPENVLSVGLTGALAWASVHVLWQLLIVTMAILIAAIKYTFVGVLLIFIVITLL